MGNKSDRKRTYTIWSHLYMESKEKKNPYSQIQRTEVITRGKVGRQVTWEKGVKTYKLPVVK